MTPCHFGLLTMLSDAKTVTLSSATVAVMEEDT